MPLPSRRKQIPCKSYRISGSSRLIFPKDQAVTRTGMLALTPLPLYQSKLNFPYSALGETISGCGRRVEHIAGCWETLGNKPCVLTKGLAYAKHFSYTSIASCCHASTRMASLVESFQIKQDKSYTTNWNIAIALTAWFIQSRLSAFWHTATQPAEPTNSFSNPYMNTNSPAQFSHQAIPPNTIPPLLSINQAQCQGQLCFNLCVQKIRLTN